jgi:hypothetical protein
VPMTRNVSQYGKMFTIFHLIQMIVVFATIDIAWTLTLEHLSNWWLILTLPVAAVIGFLLGKVPFLITLLLISLRVRRLSDQHLSERLVSVHWVDVPFVLAEMRRRDLPMEGVSEKLVLLLKSPDVSDKDYVVRAAIANRVNLDIKDG